MIRVFPLFIFLFAMVHATLASARTIEVDVIFSAPHRSHLEIAHELKLKLWADDVRFFPAHENGDLREEKAQLERVQARHPDVLVLIGEDALQAYRQLHDSQPYPAVSLMAMTLPVTSAGESHVCGIDLRPAPSMLAQSLRKQLGLQQAKRVFTFYEPLQAEHYIQQAKSAFQAEGIQLEAMPWPEHGEEAMLFQHAKTFDLYWMQMEVRSVRPDFIRALTELERRGKHVIGLSPKYFRVGMELALHLDVSRLAKEATEYINRLLAEKGTSCDAVVHSDAMRLLRAGGRQ